MKSTKKRLIQTRKPYVDPKKEIEKKCTAIRPSIVTLLRACSEKKDLFQGIKTHARIRDTGLLEKNAYVRSTLVNMYAKCGALARAQQVLDELPARDVVCWTALISGYVEQGQGQEALCCFQQMCYEGLAPNAVTYLCVLKACGIIQDVDTGTKIHNEIVDHGLLESNVVLGNALIDMYAKCGVLEKAQRIFEELSSRTVVSWSALIAGYAQQGQGKKALGCFQQMCDEGFSPDAITYLCILKACVIAQDVDMGNKMHDEIVSQGLLKNSVMLGTALIDMYAKCGAFMKALKTFNELPVRNVVAWNALIAGYAQQGQGLEALYYFRQMRSEGLSPNAITYACILKACAIMQDIDMGNKIYDEIIVKRLLEKNFMLGNALIDMYAKCGILAKAQKIFDELPVRNVVSWSALIAGYAEHGQGKEALGCFHGMRKGGFSPDVASWNALIGGYAQQGLAKEAVDCFHWMQQEGAYPNATTFVNVLNACSHSGLVDEGQKYFDSMKQKYAITPQKEHCTCMVDLFGRARLFDHAMRVIRVMPLCDDYLPVWAALIGACEEWGNVKLGRYAFDHAVQLDKMSAVFYILMSNIYIAAGMKEEVASIECLRIKNAAWKVSVCNYWRWV